MNVDNGHKEEGRFWAKVDTSGTSSAHVDGLEACWRAWELANAEIPAGMCVLHRCDNRGCVRASHLFLGTHEDNMRDMVSKGRAKSGGCRGSGCGGAVLSEEKVAIIKDKLAEGASTRQVAREFGVGRGTILAISVGRTWTHVPWPGEHSTGLAYRQARREAEARAA